MRRAAHGRVATLAPRILLYTRAMKRLALLSLCCALPFAGCAGGKIRKAATDAKEQCETDASKRLGPILGEVNDLKNAKADLEEKAKAAHEQIVSLRKSNKQLSQSAEGSKSQQQRKIQELIEDKDELGQKLNEAKRARIALAREKADLLAKNTALEDKVAELSDRLMSLNAADQKAGGEREARRAEAKAALDSLAAQLSQETQDGLASLSQLGEGFQVSLGEALFFDPKTAKLTDEGFARLDRLGPAILRLEKYDLRVEGHSDNSPIKSGLLGGFSNHWDLASARAVAVARYLHEKAGMNPRKIMAASGGEFHPRDSNGTPEGRQANRRVLLIFSRAANQ